MNIKILHLTDFHIDDLDGTQENLRSANYKPFINKLCSEILERWEQVDYIITTGDYINKGQTQNFEHCKHILSHLAMGLNIPFEKVITCVGNHDINAKLDKDDPEEARREYYSFASNFNSYRDLYQEGLFRILHDEEKDIYIVVFDATYGADGKNIPVAISDNRIDHVYKKIEDTVPVDKDLIILSHYPMDKPSKSSILIEDQSWIKNHIWKGGFDILSKVNSLRQLNKACQTVYFHGDGHIPDFWSYQENQHAFMTGMIGGQHEPSTTDQDGKKEVFNKITEFKLIEFSDKEECQIHTAQYKNDGFKLSTNTGSWSFNPSRPRYIQSRNPHVQSTPIETNSSNPETAKRQFQDQSTELISGSIEEEIIKEIEKQGLYSFAMHKTSEQYSSLGWIDIDSLMNNRSIFARCVEKARDWIHEKFPSAKNENSIFIGLDFWGASIAAQTSVLTSIKNSCVATKSKGRYNVEEEKLMNFNWSNGSPYEYVFLFSDVVSTGNSINHVGEIVQNMTAADIKIVSISLISDVMQKRAVTLDKFSKVATFCSKIRIPILSNEDLPEPKILPPRLDIS